MISLYESTATDFSKNGICGLSPTSCVVTEKAGGSYELKMSHPMDDEGKYKLLTEERLIKAPVPQYYVPEITMPTVYQWKVTEQTYLYSRIPKEEYSKEMAEAIEYILYNSQSMLDFMWISTYFYNVNVYVRHNGVIYLSKQQSVGIEPGTNFKVWVPVYGMDSYSGNPVLDPASVIAELMVNDRVDVYSDAFGEYAQVRTETAEIGFVKRDCITQTTQTAQHNIPAQTITEQVFRIYAVSCDETSGVCSVNARHVSYDFMKNLLYDCNVRELSPQEAVAAIQGSLVQDDDRVIACNIELGHVTKDWSFKNPVSALLDPDIGLVSALNARLIRNNNAFYILENSEKEGITIAYGVNMIGVKWTRDVDAVITRVIPRSGSVDSGYTYITNGGPIVSGEVVDNGKMYVESADASAYAVQRHMILNCNYKIGQEYLEASGDTATYSEAQVMEKMIADAAAQFLEYGIDVPKFTLDVNFILLGDTEEYRQYRGLQTVNIYDWIRIRTGRSGMTASAQVTEYEYDSLKRRYNRIKLGSIDLRYQRTPGYRLINESITFDKLSPELKNKIESNNGTDSSNSGSAAIAAFRQINVAPLNTVDENGFVWKGQGQVNKVWKTDENGNPGWRNDEGQDVKSTVDAVRTGLAIEAIGDHHDAVAFGQFVYVHDHNTLDEGIYVATSAISANATLSTSNLDETTDGSLNMLRALVKSSNYTTTGLTYTDAAYADGGFSKLANIVIVNIRITASGPQPQISGFPTYRNMTSNQKNIVAVSVSDSTNALPAGCMGYMTSGQTGSVLRLYGCVSGRDYIASAVYICTT